LLVAATLAALLRTLRAPSRRRVFWLFFLGGLGLANHWPLYAANAPAFALLFAAGRPWRRIPPARLAGGACMAVLGLAPYLYLLLRPHWGAPLSIFTPPQDWAAVLAYIAREPYAKEIPAAVKEWTGCAESAWQGARLLAAEYSFTGAVAAVWGAWHFLRRRPLLWGMAAVWGAAATAPLLAGYLCGDTSGGTASTVFAAYPLPAMIFVMIFIVEGLARLPKKPQIAAALALALAALAVNYPQNNRAEDRLAEAYAAAILESLPPNAVITLGGDFTFPVFYRYHALAARPDVVIADTIQDMENYPGRRHFFTANTHPPPGKPVRDWGILLELSPDGGAEVFPPAPLLDFYRLLLRHYSDFDSPFRQWDNIAARRGIFDAARALAAAKNPPSPELKLLREALVKTPEGLFGALTARMRAGNISIAEVRDTLAILRHADGFLSAWRAQILHREGILDVMAGRNRRARAKWRTALELDLSADNPALVDLLHLLAAGQDWEDYRRLRNRYWMADNPALDGADAQCAESFGAPCRIKPGGG
ncbi:MAG: hypothetical protein HAW59_06625, partial [Betaproteobacteria bacterium]|nr:hypothetical protein [Betaproteobacteria bacterium]